jgi:xanthosine utilization system XapX-like protein
MEVVGIVVIFVGEVVVAVVDFSIEVEPSKSLVISSGRIVPNVSDRLASGTIRLKIQF